MIMKFNTEGTPVKTLGIEEYQIEAHRSLRMDMPYELTCSNMCMGLAGECGETVDMLKKHIYQGKDLDINDLIEEIGDVMWYVANLCTVNNITLEECMIANADKLRKRYPNGFSIEDALARVDKAGDN